MSIILNFDSFNINNIYFVEYVKNNVKQNSYFSRIIYSTDYYALKNIYFKIHLGNTSFKEQYLKTIIYFNEKNCSLEQLYNVEREILNDFIEYRNHYNSNNSNRLIPNYNIQEQCKSGFIKVFKSDNISNNNTEILIKISGIWQTGNNIGVTFKFI